MRKIYLSNSFVFLSATLSVCAAAQESAESNHNAPSFSSLDSCSTAVTSFPVDGVPELNAKEINLLSWNIEKGSNEGWKADLEQLTQEVQLVLLQEAVFIDEMKEPRDEAVYWSFSPGYQSKTYNSGIMTLSRVQPDLTCSLKQTEPWLRSPKIASITRFPLQATKQALLLVNMHQINFELGLRVFTQQLKEVTEILKMHEGPIIFSGDFNTWKMSRIELLNKMTADIGLSAATFTPDYRKTMFGHHLDHIYTRGFDVQEASTVEVDTSDHNPLLITLSIKEA